MKQQLSLLDAEEADEPLINLTPLIDVVFVILICFVLIAPMLDIESIRLASAGPLSSKENAALKKDLTIAIKADQSLWLKGERVSFSQLEARLTSTKQGQPQLIPKLLPDKEAHFESYQRVKNLLETLGFEEMDIIVQPSP